jgi:hypothetical protein
MTAGLQITEFRADVDPSALAARRLAMRVRHVGLACTERALASLLAPAGNVRLLRLGGDGIRVALGRGPLAAEVELRAQVSPRGCILLTPVSGRVGALALPGGAVGALFSLARGAFEGKPGLALTAGRSLEVDLGALLWRAGVELPPLRTLTVREGSIELQYSALESGHPARPAP